MDHIYNGIDGFARKYTGDTKYTYLVGLMNDQHCTYDSGSFVGIESVIDFVRGCDASYIRIVVMDDDDDDDYPLEEATILVEGV